MQFCSITVTNNLHKSTNGQIKCSFMATINPDLYVRCIYFQPMTTFLSCDPLHSNYEICRVGWGVAKDPSLGQVTTSNYTCVLFQCLSNCYQLDAVIQTSLQFSLDSFKSCCSSPVSYSDLPLILVPAILSGQQIDNMSWNCYPLIRL